MACGGFRQYAWGMSPRVILAMLLALPLSSAEKPDWRFAHPQAELMVGVNVRALLKSSLTELMMQDEKAPKLTAEQLQVLEEIDGIYVSLVTKRTKGKPEEADGLVMIKGNFAGGKLMPFLQKGEFPGQPKGGKKGAKKEELTPRFVNLTTILLGDEAVVDEAVHRLKDLDTKDQTVPNPLFTRASEMDDANDLWIVGSAGPLQSEMPGGVEAMPPGFEWLNDIRSFALGVGVRNSFNLDLALNMRSRKGVDQLMGLYQKAQQQAAKDPKNKKQWDEFSEHMQVTASAGGVKFNLNLPEAEFQKTVNEMTAALKAAPKPEDGPAVQTAKADLKPAMPPPPPQPVRRTVVIYGMEGGTKEVRIQ